MSKITMENFAIMTTSYQQYSFDYTISSINSLGIKNVDIWGGTPHFYHNDYSNEEVKKRLAELRKKIEDKGMKVVIYTPETLGYPYTIADPNKNSVNRTIDFYKYSMDDALALGTNRLFLNTGTGLRDLPKEKSMEICVDSMQKICDEAYKRGITIMLEQLQPYESNICTDINAIKHIMDAVKSPALKVCVDLVAMDVANESLEMYFDTFGEDNIGFIHFSDSHHEVCGTGNLPLREYIQTLEKHNYNSIVDLEINDSIYWEDPHTPHQQTVDYLKEFIPEK